MKLTNADYYEGRKTRKNLEKKAKKDAKLLRAGEIGAGTPDLADARAIMSTYHSLKAKNIDSIIMKKPLVSGAWTVLLTFKDTPRGVPNILGAPGKPKTKAEAEKEAIRLLMSAFVKCEDTKEMMRAGEMDDLRLFSFQSLNLNVPGEMVDSAAKKVPEGISEKDMAKIRKEHIDNMHKAAGPGVLDVERWNDLSEEKQVDIMVAASFLLCVNINKVA